VWAISDGRRDESQVFYYNGSSWRRDGNATGMHIADISAVAPSTLWATGYLSRDSGSEPLTYRQPGHFDIVWTCDGKTWKPVDFPAIRTFGAAISARNGRIYEILSDTYNIYIGQKRLF
jgi:hypothetical protein